ncbi:hypothetical protein SNEBB_001806 [Seison nebaliae]|nr:hypothetical protein SNEBB_001806 [Seison nebaliae]
MDQREPCPWRIVDDTGGAFSMGLIGGTILHGIKGYRNAPAGSKRRFAGALSEIRHRAPKLGGSFAMWGGVFSLTECSLKFLRRKEDPYNSIISGAITGGVVQIRHGIPNILASAFVGGVILAIIEGSMIMLTKFQTEQMKAEMAQMQ